MTGFSPSEKTVFLLECWFSGHVQNVGFRYQVYQIAQGYEVAGFVKNLVDGRVWLQAEGTENEVLKFFEEIKSHMEAFIKEVAVEKRLQLPHFEGFMIA